MAKEIVVQGERYENADDVFDAIAMLEEQLAQMSSDAPEHASLQRHIERLREAAGDGGSADAESLHSAKVAEEPPSDAAPEEPDEEETTTDIRESFEHAKHLLCPLCGNEVDYSELPPMDNSVETCSNCQGWGQVVRPTKVDGQIWHSCNICQGNGYVTKIASTSYEPPSRAAATPEAPGAVWNADNSNWDKPVGTQPPWDGAAWDSFYGKWV